VFSLRLPKTSYTSHLSCTSCPKFTNLTTQVDLLSLLVVVPPNSPPVFSIVLWHPWLRTYQWRITSCGACRLSKICGPWDGILTAMDGVTSRNRVQSRIIRPTSWKFKVSKMLFRFC
jgi:hypothetical protein